jgi:hypothetical protein
VRVKALRGVCIGVDRHLAAGDVEPMDAALATYLAGIGAVEVLKDAAPVSDEVPYVDDSKLPARSGKKEK